MKHGQARNAGVSASHAYIPRTPAIKEWAFCVDLDCTVFAFCDRAGHGSGYVRPTSEYQIDVVVENTRVE